MVGESLNGVTQFAECSCGSACCQPSSDNENFEFTTVEWGNQLHVVFMVLPHFFGGHALRLVRFQDGSWYNTGNNGSRMLELGSSYGFRVSAH